MPVVSSHVNGLTQHRPVVHRELGLIMLLKYFYIKNPSIAGYTLNQCVFMKPLPSQETKYLLNNFMAITHVLSSTNKLIRTSLSSPELTKLIKSVPKQNFPMEHFWKLS